MSSKNPWIPSLLLERHRNTYLDEEERRFQEQQERPSGPSLEDYDRWMSTLGNLAYQTDEENPFKGVSPSQVSRDPGESPLANRVSSDASVLSSALTGQQEQQDLWERVQAAEAERAADPKPYGYRELEGPVDAFKNGLAQGIDLASVAAATAIREGGQMLGDESLEQFGDVARRKIIADFEYLQGANADTKAEWFMQTLGQTAPMVFAAVGTGILGGKAAAAVAPALGMGAMATRIAKTFGAWGGAFTSFYPMELGMLQHQFEGLERADGSIVTAEEAEQEAAIPAAEIAAMESLFEGIGLAGRLAVGRTGVGRKLFGEEAKKSIYRKLAEAMIAGGITEGITEAAQEARNITAEAEVVGNPVPTISEILEDPQHRPRINEAAKAGTAMGVFFGGLFGGYRALTDKAEPTEMEILLEASEVERATAEINSFDPDTAPVGTEVETPDGTRRKIETKNGQARWIHIDENGQNAGFAKKPTPQEWQTALDEQIKDIQNSLNVEESGVTRPQQEPPIPGVQPVVEGAADPVFVPESVKAINDLHPEQGVDVEVTRANMHQLAWSYNRNAQQIVNTKPEKEVNKILEDHRKIALDPDNGATYAERLTALGRIRAIEYARRRNKAKRQDTTGGQLPPESYDIHIAVHEMATWDDTDFDQWAAIVEAGDDPISKRILREARVIRANQPNLVGTAQDEVAKRLEDIRANDTKGLAKGSIVTAQDGNTGKVINIRNSGALDVIFEGDKDPVVVLPSEVNVTPPVGVKVKTDSGQVVTVERTSDNNKFLVTLPDGTTTVIDASTVESAGESPAVSAALDEEFEQQADEAVKKKEEEAVQIELPIEVPVVDKRTGKKTKAEKIGPDAVTLEDGTQVSIDDVAIAVGRVLENASVPVAEIEPSPVTDKREIPTFVAGTVPRKLEKGDTRGPFHINFVQIPEEGGHAQTFENLVLTSSDDQQTDAVKNLALEDMIKAINDFGLYLFPQPAKAGYRTYAIEVRNFHREATKASKTTLGWLKGSGGHYSLKSQVKIVDTKPNPKTGIVHKVSTDNISVSRVPTALASMVPSHKAMRAMSNEMLKEFILSKLTTLNFDVPAAIVNKIKKAQAAEVAARGASVVGNPDKAEVTDIFSKLASFEANAEVINQEVEARQALWDLILPEIQRDMSPEEMTMVDVLNLTSLDDLQQVEGIGDRFAEKIVEYREQQKELGRKGFEDVEELKEIRGVGPTMFDRMLEGLAKPDASYAAQDIVSNLKDEALVKLLGEMQPRTQALEAQPMLPFYEHPEVPGMFLVVDKQLIGTVNREYETTEDGDVQERLVPGEKEVFHIHYVTPEVQTIRSRTVGQFKDIKVPRSWAQPARPGGRPRAFDVIDRAESLDEAVKAMQKDRKEETHVSLHGRTHEVLVLPSGKRLSSQDHTAEQLDEAESAALDPEDPMVKSHRLTTNSKFRIIDEAKTIDGHYVVEGPIGSPDSQTFQVSEADIIRKSRSTVRESDVTLRVPGVLTPEETLREVVREIRNFDTKTRVFTVGEWRSEVPGVYGEIRPVKGNRHRVHILRKLKKGIPVLYDLTLTKDFFTVEEAESYLTDRGFSKGPSNTQASENFANLPSLGEELIKSDIMFVEEQLTDIIDFYASKGYVPQPIRDYAQKFAVRYSGAIDQYYSVGPFGNRRNRAAVGVATATDLRLDATQGVGKKLKGRQSQLTRLTEVSPEVEFDQGRIVVSGTQPSGGGDISVQSAVLLSPYYEVHDPEFIKQAKAVFEAVKHNDRFIDIANLEFDEALAHRLVEVGEEGRLGIVIDPNPRQNALHDAFVRGDVEQAEFRANVTVQVFNDGEPQIITVPKKDVVRVRDPNKVEDYMKMAKHNLGEIDSMPATPEIGMSPYDAVLGLKGVVKRDAYLEGLKARIKEILKGVSIGEGGSTVGDLANAVDQLVPAYIRMNELGFSIKNDGIEIPADLIKTLKTLSYQQLKAQFAPDSAYGDIMAKAKLNMLNARIREQVNKQNKMYNGDADWPMWKKVEHLMQNVWDPRTAEFIYQTRRELASNSFITGLPTDFKLGVEIRVPATGSTVQTLGLAAKFWSPREMASRHPTTKTFVYMSEMHRTSHGRDVKRGLRIVQGLLAKDFGMDLKRKNQIWEILQSDEIGDAMSRPSDVLSREAILKAIPTDLPKNHLLHGIHNWTWDWYYQYHTVRNLLVEARRMEIRNALFRGFHPEEIKFPTDKDSAEVSQKIDAKTAKKLKKDYNLTQNEYAVIKERINDGEKVYNLDRNSNAAYARPQSEIDVFLNLIEEYPNLASVPTAAKQGLPEWMTQEFDFWARYGIKNYAPRILQGRHKILMTDPTTGDNKLVAFAPDGATAQEFFMRVARGQIAGYAPGTEQHMYFKVGKAIADDIDHEFLGPARFASFYTKMAKEVGSEKGAQLARTAAQALRIGKERAAPRDLHNQARVSDLSEIIEDPYERLIIYWARSSRNNFLLNIEHTYEKVRAADAAVSRAHGITSVFGDKALGTVVASGDETVQEYLSDLKDSYMGRETQTEKHFNHIMALLSSGNIKPSKVLATIKDPNKSIWHDPEVFDGLYNKNYSARKYAEEQTMLTSVLRLGLNATGAAINSTQHFMTTAGELIRRGSSAKHAWTDFFASHKDYANWRTGRGNHDELLEYAQSVGIDLMPVRGAAGPGLGVLGLGRPTRFEGQSIPNHLAKLAAHYSMSMFAGAETFVRANSAFAARRNAMRKVDPDTGEKLSDEAIIQFGKEVVDSTMFQYYDQALPPIMRGSFMRVLAQFGQYPYFMAKYEYDLLRQIVKGKTEHQSQASLRNRTNAIKAFANYNLAGTTLGGGLWFSASKLFITTPLLALARSFGLSEEDDPEQLYIEAFDNPNETVRNTVGNNIADPEFFNAENFFHYGISSIAGHQMSGRYGMGGMHFDPSGALDRLLGPTMGGMYQSTYNMMYGDQGYMAMPENKKAAFMGVSLGTLATFATKRYPLSWMTNVAATTMISSKLTGGSSLPNFIADTETGQRWFKSISPNVLDGILLTLDIFGDGSMESTDAANQTISYPSIFHASYAIGSQFLGAQTMQASDERVYNNYLLRSQERASSLRRNYVDQMVAAYLRNPNLQVTNNEEVWKIVDNAMKAGIYLVPFEDIPEALQRRRQGSTEQVQERSPWFQRGYQER